ncbi:MAG: ABC transporter substrate-binding protein [Candidatus Andersenbacteria bacterium]
MRALSLPAVKLSTPHWFKVLVANMSRVERVVVSWLALTLLASAVMSIVGYIERHTQLIPQTGGTYTEAAVGQPRYLNPVLAGANDLDVDISHLVYSSLFRLDQNLELHPDLATEYTISADHREYTIHFRPDITWHDGERFTADDVIFTIRSIQTPEYGSPLESAFEGVEVQKINDTTVLFKLRQPYAPFLNTLTVGIIPEHVWESIAPRNAALAEQMLKPVGTGPFQFAEIATRRKTGDITSLRLIRNPKYYGQHPYLDEVMFSFFPTHEEAIQALTTGNVDGVGFLPLQLLGKADRQNSLDIHRLLLPQYFGLFFNQQKNDILSDAGVRNALAQATDRTQIVEEALVGEGEPLHLPIPPGIFAFNSDLPAPQFDPEAAKKNLEEAGWKDTDGDGVREKDNKRLHLKITTTDWPEYVQTAEIVQQQWQAAGVETEIEHFGAGTIQQTAVRPREYEILLFGEILSAQPDPYPFWHSTQTRNPGLNFALFKDEEVDKLLEEARKTIDVEQRQEKYEAFQGKILDIKPALILYRPYYLFATNDDVRGLEIHHAGLPSDRFNNIERWHVRTKRVWKD